MQQHGSNYILPGGGSKGPNSTFSEHDHVAYRIKWNYAHST